MKLNCRSFPGQNYRPSPVVSESRYLISIVTPWNAEPSSAEKVIQSFDEFYSSLSSDQDSTRPFHKMSSFSIEENNFHSACLQTNQKIFNEHNKEELKTGFEAVFISYSKGVVICAQIGSPRIYFSKKNTPLQPMGQSAFHYESDLSAPLPQTLLGAFKDVHIFIQSFQITEKEDQIFLLSRSLTSAAFLAEKSCSLESLGDILVEEKPELPFWLGQVTFSSTP